MRRHTPLVLPLSLVVAAAGLAAIPTGRFTITAGPGEYLAVEKGQLVLGRNSGGDENQDAPDRWYIAGTQIKSSVGGGYLAYDPSGQDNKVFLAPRPVRGADWAVRRVKGAKRRNERAPFLDAEWGTVQAASGP